MNNTGNLKEYINWLKENRPGILDMITQKECLNRINDLELSKADLDSCLKVSEQHIRNARKDEHNNQWKEAEREWNLAFTLDPLNYKKLLYLAEAYHRHFVHTGQFEYLYTSRKLLKKGMKYFPGNRQVKYRLSRINRVIRKTRGKQRVFMTFIIILIFIVLGIAFRGPLSVFLKQWQKDEIPQAVDEEPLLPRLTSGPVQINILNRSDKNLQLEVAESSMKVGEDSYNYRLNGTVSHNSKKITTLTLQQSWYSHDNKLLFRKLLHLVDDRNKQYYRKGDSLPFSDFIHETQIPDSLAYVQLTVLDLTTEKDEKDPELTPKKIIWSQDRPEGINISFNQRDSEFVQGTLYDYYQGAFVLKNEGNKAINNLEIYPVWFDSENRITPIGGAQQAVSDKEKALEAGETRALVFTFQFPAGSLDYNNSENYSISIRNLN